jgi:DNA-binding MarR family transcriptional regulator
MKPTSTIGYLLQHVAGVLQRQSDQVLQERLGIGMAQYRILMLLQIMPSVEQRKLADCLGQTEASVSRQVKVLHDKGLLVTQVDPGERRRHIVTPTAKGVKITEAAREVLKQYDEPMLATLTGKQRDQLQVTLTGLHAYTCAPDRPMACDHPFEGTDVTKT